VKRLAWSEKQKKRTKTRTKGTAIRTALNPSKQKGLLSYRVKGETRMKEDRDTVTPMGSGNFSPENTDPKKETGVQKKGGEGGSKKKERKLFR